MQSLVAARLQKALKDNLPQILSGVAVAGVIGTVVLAVKATPEAIDNLRDARNDQIEEPITLANVDDYKGVKLTLRQTIQATWRPYLPTTLCGAATIACIIGSNALGLRRQAALLGAYTLVDASFREYKDKVVEQLTAQKAQKIDDEIMEDRIKKNPPKTETIIFTGGGDQLCYDSLTGRYFKSDAETIRRAAQDIDARILQGDLYASQNEFYQELGLDSCTIGAELGWNIECRLKVVFSSHKTEDDKPCLAIGYEKMPIYNFDSI